MRRQSGLVEAAKAEGRIPDRKLSFGFGLKEMREDSVLLHPGVDLIRPSEDAAGKVDENGRNGEPPQLGPVEMPR
jgi:hypothetical protein